MVIYFEKILNVAEQALGHDSPALAGILAQLAHFYLSSDRREAAEKILVRITGLIGNSPPEQTPGYLSVLQLQGQLNAERGDVDAAEEIFNRAIAFAAKYGGPPGGAVGSNLFNLATVYLKAGRFSGRHRELYKGPRYSEKGKRACADRRIYFNGRLARLRQARR